MSYDLSDILDNVKNVSMSKHAMAAMLEFERVIDELDVYTFRNWMEGELVEGPKIEKHFVTCTFMWPYKAMPDPRGGEQLLGYNCIVTYEKTKLIYPKKVEGYDDFKPGTKMPETTSTPVWLVSITMPRLLMDEFSEHADEMLSLIHI